MMKRIVWFLTVSVSVATLFSPHASASLIVPDLGDAADFGLFAIPQTGDAASITISSASGVQGDLAIGNPGLYHKSGAGVVTGKVFLATGVTTSITGVPGAEGTLVPNSDLTQAISDALLASSAAALLPITQPALGDLTATQTVTGNGDVNVLSVSKIDLSGSKILTLSGSPTEFFILNISGDFDLSGSSAIAYTGGLVPSHVLFNFPTTGTDIGFSASSTAKGTLLAPFRDFTLHGANLEGEVIANDIRITSGGQVKQNPFESPLPPPPPPPPSSAIPEPGTLVLCGLGATTIRFRCRRRRSSSG